MPYSTRFFLGAGTEALQTLYTVPDSYVAVVRDVSYFATSAVTNVYLVVAESPGSPAAVIASVGDLAADAGAHWEGRQVMNEGDLLELGAYGAALLVTVSGYLLSAP